jgi:hypothetical protein
VFVPRTTAGLQVTVRLEEVKVLREPPPTIEVMQAGLTAGRSDGMIASYEAFALVRPLSNRDTEAALVFHFYNEQRVQVATCESGEVLIQPEVARRVTCSTAIDAGSPQPVMVLAETKPVE